MDKEGSKAADTEISGRKTWDDPEVEHDLNMPRPMAESIINHKHEKTPGYAWLIWIVTYLISFAAPLGQFKIVAIPDDIIVSFILPVTTSAVSAYFGALMTAVSVIGVILAFPTAFICRKIGLRWTVTLSGLGVLIGGLIPFLVGPSFAALCVGRVIEGLGIGLVGVAAPTLITLWFPDKTRGFALGLWCTWVPLAITVDSALCPRLDASFGWKGVFLFIILFTLVSLILFNIFYKVPEGEGADYNVEGGIKECFALLKNKHIWFLCVVFIIYIAGQTGIVNTYLPTFLAADPSAVNGGFGWSAAKAGFGLACVTTIGLISNPLGGTICAKLPDKAKRAIPVAVSIIYLFCFYLLFQNHSTVLLWAGIVLMGLCAGFGGGGLRPIAPAIMNQSAMAATMGMSVLQFGQCLGNCFSPIYGGLIDGGASYWSACLHTIVPMAVVMLICAALINPAKSGRNKK